ncbi:MAG: ComEC/Rec2 family competence protein [Bacteroidia bacterium]
MRLLFFYGVRNSSTVSFWKSNPLSAVCLFYIIGLFAYTQAGQFALVTLLASIPLIVLSNLVFASTGSIVAVRKSKSFLILALFASLAAVSASISDVRNKNRIGAFDLQGDHLFRLVIAKHCEADSAGVLKFSAAISHYYASDLWSETHAKVKCRLLCKPGEEFNQGTILYLFGSLDFPLPDTKSDFNYSHWLNSNGYSALLNTRKSWLRIPSENSFHSTVRNLRTRLIGSLNDDEYPDADRYLARALLLGDREKLDPEQMQQFSTSGIIHLLAVSGLHVGLIYQGLIFILALFLPKPEKNKGAIVLIIPALWVYAIITGFSPSVCRAALMLSLGLLAGIMRQRKLPFNTLFGAALIILAFNPGLILNTGFLLSFSAVAGILFSAPLLNQVQAIPYKVTRIVLGASVISVAAQLVTIPVVLYTFGKFPVYFLPANLLAVPLATLVSFSGFLSLLFSRISYLGDVLLWLCMTGIHWLSGWSAWISQLPFSSLTLNKPDLSQALIISAFILCLFLLVNQVKMHQILKLVLIFTLISSLLQLKRFTTFEHEISDTNRVHLINRFHKVSIEYSSSNNGTQKLTVCNRVASRFLLLSNGQIFPAFSRIYKFEQ